MLKPITVEISAYSRATGSLSAKQLRSENKVPGVLYGPKLESNIHVAVEELDVERLVSSGDIQFVQLVLENGESYKTLIKKVEYHPVTDRPIHVDYYVIDEETPVTITVPITLTGVAPGVTVGGRLFQPLRKLRIKAKPAFIPARFELSVEKMKIGSTLRVRRLKTDGVEPLMEERRTIATVKPPRTGLAGLEADALASGDDDDEDDTTTQA